MEDKKSYSYGYKPFTTEEKLILEKYHTTDTHEYIRMGPAGYVLPANYLTHGAAIHDMKLRPDDIFVVSYPRSGTTWTQELVWLLANDLDFKMAKSISLDERFPFLEFFMFFRPEDVTQKERQIWEKFSRPATEILSKMTSQRFIKTHLPLSLLPTALLDTSKVVYVARDMRDVAVSVYHFYKLLRMHGVECDFNEYYQNMFSKNMLKYTPYFEHLKEAWVLRDHPNMLFLFYEDLSKDLPSTAKRVANFLGKQYTDEQFESLCAHLNFDNFKNNESVNALIKDLQRIDMVHSKKGRTDNIFIRKGKCGGWRDHFSKEMSDHAENWMSEQLDDIGLTFPR
ncbi:sulfotransferase domain-containing protein [Phthorimaea operculella]|nr:sulfotransferase domain-containing protein [Phthorimaea operculella]